VLRLRVLQQPGATRTIDRRYVPSPPSKFGGEKSKPPYWPARVVPPKSAPNATVDVGLAPSRFGGVIPTPALDRIANGVVQLRLLLFGFRQRTYLRIRQPQLDPGQLFEFVGVNGHDL
jgi:hypothetical protein